MGTRLNGPGEGVISCQRSSGIVGEASRIMGVANTEVGVAKREKESCIPTHKRRGGIRQWGRGLGIRLKESEAGQGQQWGRGTFGEINDK